MAPALAPSPKTLSPVSSLSRLDSEAFDKLRSNSYVQRTTIRNLGVLQVLCIVVFVLVTYVRWCPPMLNQGSRVVPRTSHACRHAGCQATQSSSILLWMSSIPDSLMPHALPCVLSR